MDHDAAKLRYGKAVTVAVDNLPPILFRPLTLLEAKTVSAKLVEHPDLTLNTSIEACMKCCLSNMELYNRFVDSYPLMMDGPEGVLSQLMALARDDAKTRVKGAARRWRRGDRNYGHTAENLLAFKAYQGGDYSEEQLAGALAIAEWAAATKNLCKLVEGLMKALAKKKGG